MRALLVCGRDWPDGGSQVTWPCWRKRRQAGTGCSLPRMVAWHAAACSEEKPMTALLHGHPAQLLQAASAAADLAGNT
jgi:hypothetical protein